MINKKRYPLLFDFCIKNFIECDVKYIQRISNYIKTIELASFDFKNTLTGKNLVIRLMM